MDMFDVLCTSSESITKFTREHLELLKTEGIVQHRNCGRVKFFRFANTVKTQATLKLLEEWERS
jgi:hypothetical protein